MTKGSLSAEVRCRNKLKIFINSDPSGINCTPHPAGVYTVVWPHVKHNDSPPAEESTLVMRNKCVMDHLFSHTHTLSADLGFRNSSGIDGYD